MRQFIYLIWIISLLQEISCNPDFKEQQKSIFQQSKNIVSYLPIKSGSRWESLNSAISFGTIFGQQNSTTIMPDTSMHASLENSTLSNDEAVLTIESEQSYKSCMMRCQALSSTNNETLDEFTCGCDQLLKPNKIPYKYRDQYIIVKKNPFHAVKPTCQNCSKPEKQVKEEEPVKQRQNTTIDGSIRIKNNGSKQIFESQPKPQKIYKEVPSEQQNSTSFQKQIKIKKNSEIKINKVKQQNQDLLKNETIDIKINSKSEPQQKISKIKENEQVRVKNSGIVKKQQNISKPKQTENIKKQYTNQTNEGIRIKSEQKKVKKQEVKQEELKIKEVKKDKEKISEKQIINPVKAAKIKTEEQKLDGSIRIKNNDNASTHDNSTIPHEPVVKKASKQSLNISKIKVNKEFKSENKKILKGIPVKENVKYSYVNKTKPIQKKEKKIVKKNKTKKIIKSKVFGRNNDTIPVKDNYTKEAKNATKKLKKKIKVMKQQKIPIKSKPVQKVSPVIQPAEPQIEIDTRIRIKREGKQLVIPKPIVEEKQPIQNIKNPEKEVDNQIKETSKHKETFKEEIKIKQEISQPIEIKKKQKKVVEENDQKPEPKQNRELEKNQIRIKNNGSKILNTLKIKKILKSQNTLKVNLTKEQVKIPSETKTEEVQPVKEIQEIKHKDQSQPEQIENKCKVLPKEDHSIRIKNNGSRKTHKKIHKKKSKKNKSKIIKQNIPKVVKQPIINDQVPIKVKTEKSLNKTIIVKQEIQKQPTIINYSNNSIRIKNNGSKQILQNSSKILKSNKIISAKVIKQKENVSIDSIQSSSPKISEDSSKIRVNKKDKIIQDSDQNLQKKPNAEFKEDNSIRVKNNGSVSTILKKQKKSTQIKKKKQSSNDVVNKVIETSISKQNISSENILKKNISKHSILKNNITVYKVKVDIPPVAKVSKKEQVIEKQPSIENEKSDESTEEKKKQLEREMQYAKEIYEKPQKLEVKTIKPDELSIRIKNNGTITFKKELNIIHPKPLNNSVPCNKIKIEAVPVIKDTQKHRKQINYSKPIENYKESTKIYKPFIKSVQPHQNITVSKESKEVKQSDSVSPQLNATKIPKAQDVSAHANQSIKSKKNIEKEAGQKLKEIAKQNFTNPKKIVEKVIPPKIEVKSYPITNVPVHSRDVQKGESIPMKKRKSKKNIVNNISKIESNNVTKVNNSVEGNATHKKSKKKLIPVMTKTVKVVNQSEIKVVKKMKKDESIEEKPLKSVVDEVITKPLQKPKKNVSIPKSQHVKKEKLVLNNNKTIKIEAANISNPQQTLKNISLPVKNIAIKKQKLNISKKEHKVVKQSIPKLLNKSVAIEPIIISKEKKDDEKEHAIKVKKFDKDEDHKEVCKQPEVKKTQDEIQREIRVKNSDVIQNLKSASHDNYKAKVNYQTNNRTTTINFSDDDGSATISITNINGTQLLNVTGEKIACQSKFCKKYSSISQIFSNQRNMTLMTPIVSDFGSLSQDTLNSSMSKSEKKFQAQFIKKKLNENSDYNEVLRSKEKLKHSSFRIQKLLLLGNLIKKFFNKNDFQKEWFVRPVIFHFLEFKFIKDKPKVSIIRSIRARNLLGVIKSFKFTIKNKFLKNNNMHYGIVGNSKLLFSTSSFQNFLDPKNSQLQNKMNYTSNKNEFVNDNISKIFVGYGFFKQIIKLPANFRTQKYPILLSVDKNSFAQEISIQSQLSLNQNILQQKNKNRFLFDEKGNLVKSSETNFKAFITLVNSFQKKGLFKGVILDQNQLGVKLRKGLPPKGFQRQIAYAFSPRSMRQVKEGQNNTKNIVNVKENQCKKYLDGSKRYQVCILNDQYRGPKQVINLSRKYNFGAIVYDPERNKISKAADILSSSMRRGLKTIQWNLVQKYIKNRKNYQFMTFSENGPLVCSKNRSDNLCKLMTGYSLTQGWWKNPKFIDSQKLDQFYVIVKNLKTNIIEFINTGCDQEYAVNLMKKMTSAKKNSIGAVLNSDSQFVEMTLTNPNNENDMQYKSIYEIIGEYLSNNIHLFDKNLRNEYEAGIQ